MNQNVFRQNGIRTLESGTFDGVPSLSFIDLGRNMLKSVDSSMFQSNVNIRIVDLGKFLNDFFLMYGPLYNRHGDQAIVY